MIIFHLNANHSTESSIVPFKKKCSHIFSALSNFISICKSDTKIDCFLLIDVYNDDNSMNEYASSVALTILFSHLVQKNLIDLKNINHVFTMHQQQDKLEKINKWSTHHIDFTICKSEILLKNMGKIHPKSEFPMIYWLMDMDIIDYSNNNLIIDHLDKNYKHFPLFVFMDQINNSRVIDFFLKNLKYEYTFESHDSNISHSWIPINLKSLENDNQEQDAITDQMEKYPLNKKTGIIFLKRNDHVSKYLNMDCKNRWLFHFHHILTNELLFFEHLVIHLKENDCSCITNESFCSNLYSCFVSYVLQCKKTKSKLYCNSF